jgi:hypothetical protein
VALLMLRVCGGAAAAFQYTRVDFSAATYSSSAARSCSGAARMQYPPLELQQSQAWLLILSACSYLTANANT